MRVRVRVSAKFLSFLLHQSTPSSFFFFFFYFFFGGVMSIMGYIHHKRAPDRPKADENEIYVSRRTPFPALVSRARLILDDSG